MKVNKFLRASPPWTVVQSGDLNITITDEDIHVFDEGTGNNIRIETEKLTKLIQEVNESVSQTKKE